MSGRSRNLSVNPSICRISSMIQSRSIEKNSKTFSVQDRGLRWAEATTETTWFSGLGRESLHSAFNDDEDVADIVHHDVQPLTVVGRPTLTLMLSNAPARKTPPRASYASTPVPPANAPPDPLRVSAIHLLSRAHNLPCSSAAQAFSQLVQPTSRFQLALDALLPLLSTANTEVSTSSRLIA